MGDKSRRTFKKRQIEVEVFYSQQMAMPQTDALTSRSTRTRAALVEATLTRLRADGSFTAEQVATDAGVSVATIYNRFPDGRDGLLLRRSTGRWIKWWRPAPIR